MLLLRYQYLRLKNAACLPGTNLLFLVDKQHYFLFYYEQYLLALRPVLALFLNSDVFEHN